MAKQRTHSGAKKRFKLTNSGNLKRARQGRRHILTKKTTKRKRNLRRVAYISPAQDKTVRRLLNA